MLRLEQQGRCDEPIISYGHVEPIRQIVGARFDVFELRDDFARDADTLSHIAVAADALQSPFGPLSTITNVLGPAGPLEIVDFSEDDG